MSAEDQMLIIRRNDFLDKLTGNDYETLNILHNYIIADKEAYIYFDAQFLNKLYFVKEGYVKIGNIDDNGEELVKEILEPGDVFGQFMLERNSLDVSLLKLTSAKQCFVRSPLKTLNDCWKFALIYLSRFPGR